MVIKGVSRVASEGAGRGGEEEWGRRGGRSEGEGGSGGGGRARALHLSA